MRRLNNLSAVSLVCCRCLEPTLQWSWDEGIVCFKCALLERKIVIPSRIEILQAEVQNLREQIQELSQK